MIKKLINQEDPMIQTKRYNFKKFKQKTLTKKETIIILFREKKIINQMKLIINDWKKAKKK